MKTNEFIKNKRNFQVLQWLGVILFYLILSLLFTYPLITQITNSVIGHGDNLQWVWEVGWFQKAIFNLHVYPLHSYLLNYPFGYNLAVTEFSPLQIALALPFSLIISSAFGFNLSMLLTFILSGLTMVIWVRRLTNNWQAAIIAGSIYAFLPYHITHFEMGQLNIAAIQWFPLYFMGFFDLLKMHHWDWKPILISGISLGLIAMSSEYYIYMTLFLSVFIIMVYLIKFDRKLLLKIDSWKKLLATALVALPFFVIGIGPFLRLGGNAIQYGFDAVSHFSASITDYLLPATRQALLGQWVGQNFPRDLWTEATLYIGIVAGLLALIAVINRKKLSHAWILQLMLWGGILALILSFGTNLVWMEKPVMINTPGFLSSLIKDPQMPIYLPGYLLFRYFPLYDKMRAWMRWGIFFMLFIALAAGLASAWLLEKLKGKKKGLAFIFLLLLLLIDFFPHFKSVDLMKIEARPLDTWLTQQVDNGGLIYIPFDKSNSYENVYYTLINNKPIIGQLTPIFSNRYFVNKSIFDKFPDQASVELLRKDKITYVVVYDEYFPDLNWLIAKCKELGLHYEISLAGQSVFTLTP